MRRQWYDMPGWRLYFRSGAALKTGVKRREIPRLRPAPTAARGKGKNAGLRSG